jgi:hypothetical protein
MKRSDRALPPDKRMILRIVHALFMHEAPELLENIPQIRKLTLKLYFITHQPTDFQA